MTRIVVSHSYGATAESVWYPYLRARLVDLGHVVEIPQLPNDDTNPEPWNRALTDRLGDRAVTDTVLVGHSVGGVNLLRLLERHDVAANGAFAGVVLVSTPTRDVGYDSLRRFFEAPFDWAVIRGAAKEFRVLAAVDDLVNVPDPVIHVRDLIDGLGATAVITPTGGHFGTNPDDHMDLPESVRLVLDCLSAPAPAPGS